MITKKISVKNIISKVYRDLQLTEEVNWQDMIEWCGEALEHIGTIGQTEHRICNLTVANYKTTLPCDFLEVQQISYKGAPLRKSTSTFGNLTTPATPTATDQTSRAAIGTTNLESTSYVGQDTYTIDPVYIKTSFREGTITLSYTAFPVDEEGFPEVPDDISYREALFAYIVKKLKYIDFLDGKLNITQYRLIEKNWEFYCRQAAAKMQMPNIDQLENIKNWSLRLLPNIGDYNNYFARFGSEQQLRKGNTTI